MIPDMPFPASRKTATLKLFACGRHASVGSLFCSSPNPPSQNTHTFQYQITKDGTISLTQLTTTAMRDRLGEALDNGECPSWSGPPASGYSHRAGSKYFWPQCEYKFGGPVYV
jgi:hypothetical protein